MSGTHSAGLKFQSTPSVGRATLVERCINTVVNISIHALRGEGDVRAELIKQLGKIISIHALRGEGDLFSKSI